MKILVVCTGNTCRSPLAEVTLRRAVSDVGLEGVEVSSAGTGAFVGEPASEGSYLVALEQGLDLAAHRARVVTREMVAESYLILAMSRGHLRRWRKPSPLKSPCARLRPGPASTPSHMSSAAPP